jgi:hypothetical protein
MANSERVFAGKVPIAPDDPRRRVRPAGAVEIVSSMPVQGGRSVTAVTYSAPQEPLAEGPWEKGPEKVAAVVEPKEEILVEWPPHYIPRKPKKKE